MDSEMRHALNVLKVRDSSHETGLRQYAISDHGLAVGEKLEGLTGVLGWSVLRERDSTG